MIYYFYDSEELNLLVRPGLPSFLKRMLGRHVHTLVLVVEIDPGLLYQLLFHSCIELPDDPRV